MISIEAFRELALSFPDVTEQDHFGMPSFRVKKKIFSTLWINEQRAMIKLPLVEQSIFCDYDKTIFYPVPNAWGKKGTTFVELKKVQKRMLKDALTIAWKNVATR